MPQTRTEVDADTITFIPHTILIPETSVKDFIWQSTSDISTLLTHPPKSTAQVLELRNTTKMAYFS